ncbi:rho-N domain-containing protein 1, chloroplastic-like isoform X2 [Benincasa hispida]|uniref:rho-N domain-containing protein 1, chloroplastic-like isoform X2 n=1 Tax=Benincasa hispida TaxID=102211 RepID=UPI001901E4CC|nr:rho-N domain-containing protein 1, chloroplastic-like isoform X2 [Benincasa hispida]
MSQAIHLLPNNLTDSRCLPCSGVSGRAASVSSRSLCAEHRIDARVKFRPLNCTSLGASFTCKASSGGHRRNPDFSKQNRHGFSRSRNRQNEERESLDNVDESDLLSSKNGPLLSISSTPKSQATATPGPREKEIVELFRKVQAQLRERAAMKEEKKIEAQGQTKGSETVDSLLKLLRKHSVEQGKRSSGGGSGGGSSSKDFNFNHVKENGHYDEGKGTSIFGLSANLREKAQEPTGSFSRPVSNFQRKSPVPRVKYQPIFPGESIVDSTDGVNSKGVKLNGTETRSQLKAKVWTRQESTERGHWEELQSQGETKQEPELDQEYELEPEAESYELEHDPDETESELVNLLGVSSDLDDTFDDDVKDNEKFAKHDEHEDLNSLKVAELRAIAKSRSLKGFSKMKKSELVQLLSDVHV